MRPLVGKRMPISVLALLVSVLTRANAHGRMLEPPARNTLWRFGYNAPANYNDNELFCGGIRGITANKGRCGICGDPYDGRRIHETGGSMALNTTTRNYFPGSSIDLMIEIVANHGGLFRFEVCWRDDASIKETEDCFEALPLSADRNLKLLATNSLEAGHKTREYLNSRDDDDSLFDYELDPAAGNGFYTMSVDLPQNKTCEHCILRWHWTVANNWGKCDDGTEAVGCGYQEVYRNCADISVTRSGAGIGTGFNQRRRKRSAHP